MVIEQSQVDRVVAFLELYGREIGEKASAGDPLSKNIISTYQLFYKHQERGSLAILEAFIEKYGQTIDTQPDKRG